MQFGGRLFRQVIGIPMGTNRAPLLADLFLYSYENEFLDNMIRSGHRRLVQILSKFSIFHWICLLFIFYGFVFYLKEYIRKAEYRSEQLQESAD